MIGNMQWNVFLILSFLHAALVVRKLALSFVLPVMQVFGYYHPLFASIAMLLLWRAGSAKNVPTIRFASVVCGLLGHIENPCVHISMHSNIMEINVWLCH